MASISKTPKTILPKSPQVSYSFPLPLWLVLACGVQFLTSCQTLDQLAPPPAGTNVTLVKGRQIYVTKCAKCHSPEPVQRYSRSEWHKIMPEMVEETNLSLAEADAVTAYVMSLASP